MKFAFNVGNEKFMNTPVDEMTLASGDCIPRGAANSLHRAGFNTVGDIINNISNVETMSKFRGMGKTAMKAVRNGLINTYLECLSPKEQDAFWARVEVINHES